MTTLSINNTHESHIKKEFPSIISKVNSLKSLLFGDKQAPVSTMTSITSKQASFVQNLINTILKGMSNKTLKLRK